MTPEQRAVRAALLLALSLPCCGGRVVIDETASPGDDAMPDAGPDAAEDAGPPVPPQCLCPDQPGYAPCVLPLMCCPCVAQCEDPATFNCSCSETMTCS